jgi:U3 small nucleolar RNA-associated protein MPP10
MSFLDKIEEFYKPNQVLNGEIKEFLKQLHDLNHVGLKLFVQDFEEEQIWTQMQYLRESLDLKILKKKFDLIEEKKAEEEVEEEDEEEEVEVEKNKDEEEEEEEVSEEEEEDINDFIGNMEDFLDKQEELEDEQDGELDEEVDVEIYGNDDEIKPKRKQEEEEEEEDLDEALDGKLLQMKQDGEEEEGEESEDEGFFDTKGKEEEEEKEFFKKKTKFEKEQDELIQEMDQLENQNLEIKKWQMSGEASSWTRPQNSLLEEDVDFRHTSKVKPIITEEITQNLEEIILNRIINNIYDDPQKPDLNEEKKKKLNEVKREKNEKSLSELYEDVYLKNRNLEMKQENNPEVLENKTKVRQAVSKVLHMLNVLSNLNYIPEPTEYDLVTKLSVEQPSSSNKLIDKTPNEIMKPIKNIKEKSSVGMTKKEVKKEKTQKELLEKDKKRMDFSKSKDFFKLMEEKK